MSRSPSVAELSKSLAEQPELWGFDTFWKDFPIPIFREVDTIYLRFPDKEAFRSGMGDVNVCTDQPAAFLLPAKSVLDELLSIVGGSELGRVLVNRLMPGAKVLRHSDGKNLSYSRYHVVLETNDDVEFICGNEKASMRQGECWWFNNSEEHEVTNHGKTPRIHLIADIR